MKVNRVPLIKKEAIVYPLVLGFGNPQGIWFKFRGEHKTYWNYLVILSRKYVAWWFTNQTWTSQDRKAFCPRTIINIRKSCDTFSINIGHHWNVKRFKSQLPSVEFSILLLPVIHHLLAGPASTKFLVPVTSGWTSCKSRSTGNTSRCWVGSGAKISAV